MMGRRAVLAVWLLACSLALGALVLLVAGWSASLPDSFGFRGYAILLAGTFGTVGALIGVRLPGNRIGWLFLASALSMGLLAFVTEYVIYGTLVRPGMLPAVRPLAWLETWGWVPFVGLSLTFLPLLFPDGHLASPRWRPVVWLALGTIVFISSTLALVPGPIENASFVDNPLTVPGLERSVLLTLSGAGFVLLVSTIMLAAASLVVRLRRSDAAERAQLKWVAFAVAFAAAVAFGPGMLFNVARPAGLEDLVKLADGLAIVAFLGIPISAGIAILRYHLYDIDRIISRTVSYGVMTGLLIAAYAGLILLLQGPLDQVTGGDTIAVAVSTLAVAALFQPMRQRVQRVVDRRFNRARYDADRTTSAFADRLRDEIDIDSLTLEVTEVVKRSLAPAWVGVWVRGRR